MLTAINAVKVSNIVIKDCTLFFVISEIKSLVQARTTATLKFSTSRQELIHCTLQLTK